MGGQCLMGRSGRGGGRVMFGREDGRRGGRVVFGGEGEVDGVRGQCLVG